MLVSGVFSSCAARERNRSLRDSRSAAASTAAARVSNGRSGRRSRSPRRNWRERAPTRCSWRQSGTAAESSPHSTRPVSTPRAASSCEQGSPSQPSICRPAAVRRWTATPAAPDRRRASLAILPASSRVFSPASAASASCVAAPEARNALSMRRCREKMPERKRRARCSRALWNDPRRSRIPSRKKPRGVPARACCTRVWSVVERALGGGRRSHADQNGSRCAGRSSSTRRTLRNRGSRFGTPAPQSGHARSAAKLGKRANRASAGRHGACKGPAEGPLPDPRRGRAAGTHTGSVAPCHASGRTGTRPPGDTGGGRKNGGRVAGAGRFARGAGPGRALGAPVARTGDGPRRREEPERRVPPGAAARAEPRGWPRLGAHAHLGSLPGDLRAGGDAACARAHPVGPGPAGRGGSGRAALDRAAAGAGAVDCGADAGVLLRALARYRGPGRAHRRALSRRGRPRGGRLRRGGEMSWWRVGALVPAVLACCAQVAAPGETADAGASQPTVADVEPQPGTVPANARFAVHFSESMDEGQLLAASGRSETVALVPEADVERAAAAIEHAPLSAHERNLLVPAAAQIASDRKSVTLVPEQALPPGGYYLLVSPRLKDERGRRLAGNGARFGYQVPSPPRSAKLITPSASGETPWNLAVARAFAEAGRVALIGPGGREIASADAHGPVELHVSAPLVAGGGPVLHSGCMRAQRRSRASRRNAAALDPGHRGDRAVRARLASACGALHPGRGRRSGRHCRGRPLRSTSLRSSELRLPCFRARRGAQARAGLHPAARSDRRFQFFPPHAAAEVQHGGGAAADDDLRSDGLGRGRRVRRAAQPGPGSRQSGSPRAPGSGRRRPALAGGPATAAPAACAGRARACGRRVVRRGAVSGPSGCHSSLARIDPAPARTRAVR